MDELQKLKEKQKKIVTDQRKMFDLAEKEQREFTSDEETKFQKLEDEYNSLTDEINEYSSGPILGQSNLVRNQENRNQTIHVRSTKNNKRISNNMNNNKNTYIFDEEGSSLRDAFNRYLRYGKNALSSKEYRALQGDLDTQGGFLVTPTQVAQSVIQELDDAVFVRRMATKFTVEKAHSLGCPAIDDDFGDPEWTSEIRTGSEDSDLDFDRRDLYPHPAARRIKVSNKLLRASSLNPEQIVQQRMIYKMSTVHENGFLNGDGVNKPLGVFVADANGINTDRDSSNGNGTTNVSVDGLINAVGMLKATYRQGAEWIFHRDLETKIRKLKDGEGNYLWKASIDGTAPNTLLGFPVNLSEFAPNTFTTGKYVAVLGNFKFYYIVDALDMQIQRLEELYAETNRTGFIIRTETDGMPVLSSAFVRVKLS